MADPMTGVFVLGMHRAGTSATTRAINLLGVPLAREDELMPASPNNPTGFWEVTRLTDFNNKLLAELGGSSLAPPALEAGWGGRPELDQRRQRARRLMAKTHETSTWAWKDPRNCVLFPFWREALEVRPLVVLVHRDPAGVALSLETRQGLSRAMSFAVWERYMRSALSGAAGLPVFAFGYADLVGDPEAWAHRAGSFLRDHGVECEPQEGARLVAEHVQANPGGAGRLREPGTGPAPPPGSLSTAPAGAFEPSGEQLELAATLESLSGSHAAFVAPDLPPETAWAEPLLAERRRADLIRDQMNERMRATRRRARAAKEAAQSQSRPEPEPRARRSLASRLSRRRARRTSTADGAGRLPDYLIIGAQKCGTSSLFRYLDESPHVELPSEKEVHFFDNQFHLGLDWYRSRFPPAGRGRRSITGEASPYYVFHPLVAQRVRETLPDVRLMLMLRDPVDRAASHYYHEVGNGAEELPLPAALDREPERLAGEAERMAAEPGYSSYNHRHFSYQARGVYVDQLEHWRSVFPEEQILVLSSDALFRDPRREMRRVYEFLGLPGTPSADPGAYNRRDYPPVPAEVEDRLARHFAPHNARLYELLGEDWGWQAPLR